MRPARNRPPARPLVRALLLSLAALLSSVAPPALAAPRLESGHTQLHLKLTGALRLSGTTPLGLEALPPGHYRLNVGGPGLSRSVGRLTRAADGRLATAPIGGPTALLLPPGYLHLEQGEGGRALSMAGVAALLGAGVLFEELDRGKALDDVAQAERDYARAVSSAEFQAARLAVVEARSHVSDSREVRNLWVAALGYVWIGSALESWLLTPAPGLSDRGAGTYEIRAAESSRAGATLRSLVVPGGGQRYLGHSGRGALFLGAVGAAGAFSLVAHDSYLTSRREEERTRQALDAATDPQEIALLRLEQKQASETKRDRNRLRWAGLAGVAGLYLWNVLDARGLAIEHAVPGNLSLNVAPAGDGLTAALSWRLP